MKKAHTQSIWIQALKCEGKSLRPRTAEGKTLTWSYLIADVARFQIPRPKAFAPTPIELMTLPVVARKGVMTFWSTASTDISRGYTSALKPASAISFLYCSFVAFSTSTSCLARSRCMAAVAIALTFFACAFAVWSSSLRFLAFSVMTAMRCCSSTVAL